MPMASGDNKNVSNELPSYKEKQIHVVGSTSQSKASWDSLYYE